MRQTSGAVLGLSPGSRTRGHISTLSSSPAAGHRRAGNRRVPRGRRHPLAPSSCRETAGGPRPAHPKKTEYLSELDVACRPPGIRQDPEKPERSADGASIRPDESPDNPESSLEETPVSLDKIGADLVGILPELVDLLEEGEHPDAVMDRDRRHKPTSPAIREHRRVGEICERLEVASSSDGRRPSRRRSVRMLKPRPELPMVLGHDIRVNSRNRH